MSAPLIRGSLLRALHAFSASTPVWWPPAGHHARCDDGRRTFRLPTSPPPLPDNPLSLPSRLPLPSTSSPWSPSVTRSSSCLPGLRLEDDDGFGRLRVGGGGVESNSDDGPLKAMRARLPLACSERRRAFKHL